MVEFRMPSLGADMEAGTLVEWLVKPGDQVKRGDIVAVVETQKGAIEIEIFETGQVEQLLVDLDARCRSELRWRAFYPTRRPSRRCGCADAGEPDRPSQRPSGSPALVPPAPPRPASPRNHYRRPAAACAHRRQRGGLPRCMGVDLATIRGNGPAGAITYADVERSLAAVGAPPEKKRAIGLDLDAMRTAIAAAMARSKREIPHYYLEHQIDVTRASSG